MTASLLLSPPSGNRLLQTLQRLWSSRCSAQRAQRAQQPAEATDIPAAQVHDNLAWMGTTRPLPTPVDAGLFNTSGRWLV
jgi:hypothetical protein